MNIAGATELNFNSAYKGLMTAITVKTTIVTDNEILADLFTSGGMAKMMGDYLAYFMCYGLRRNYGCYRCFGQDK